MGLNFFAQFPHSLIAIIHTFYMQIVTFRWEILTAPTTSNVLQPSTVHTGPGSSFADPITPLRDFYNTSPFPLDLSGASSAKEQLLVGLLESLGLDDWIPLEGTLGTASGLPEISWFFLFPVAIVLAASVAAWLVYQELLPNTSVSELLALNAMAEDVLVRPSRSLTQLAFGNLEDVGSFLDAPPSLGSAPAVLKVASYGAPKASSSTLAPRPATSMPPCGDVATDLAPMVFTDPTTFSTDDPDSPQLEASMHFPISDNTVSAKGDYVSIMGAEKNPDSASLDMSAAVDGHEVPPAAPSFDVLEPLAAASSDLAIRLLDENLEDSLSDEALKSSGLITPVDSVAEVVAGAGTVVDESTDDLPSLISQHGSDLSYCSGANSKNTTLLPAEGSSTSENPTICARLPAGKPEEDGQQSLLSNKATAPSTGPTEPNDSALATPDDLKKGYAATAEATLKSLSASTVASEEVANFTLPAWSLVSPNCEVSELVDELVTAQDWTTIKCYMGMQDDRANESELKQITFIQEYRLPIHFPDPHSVVPSNIIESFPDSNDLFRSPPIVQAGSPFKNEHRRALSEPPPLSDRYWICTKVDPTPKLSATRARQNISKDTDERFPLTSPELQARFSLISAQLGFITHNRSHLRFVPQAQVDHTLENERAALRLAAAPQLRRRHSMGGFQRAKYELTGSMFLDSYIPCFKDQLSYAAVTGTGVEPLGRVVTMDTGDRDSPGRLNIVKFVEVNRNRSGPDVNINGADFKAEYTRPLQALRRDPNHPLARTLSRHKSSGGTQTSTLSTLRDRQARQSLPRTPSFTGAVQQSLGHSNSSQSNAHVASPDIGDHNRTRSESPFASTPDRQKRTRFAGPPVAASPSTSSPSLSPRQQSLLARRPSASPLPRLSIIGRSRNPETVISSPIKAEPTTAVTTVHSSITATPSLDAMTAIVEDDGKGSAAVQTYARIDDDAALEKFESELGLSSSSR